MTKSKAETRTEDSTETTAPANASKASVAPPPATNLESPTVMIPNPTAVASSRITSAEELAADATRNSLAMAAMTGLLANSNIATWDALNSGTQRRGIAMAAWKMADAMVKADLEITIAGYPPVPAQ